MTRTITTGVVVCLSAAALAPLWFPEPPDAPERLAPGIVAWHPGFEAAVRASADSGKPVLLFEGVGELDSRHL